MTMFPAFQLCRVTLFVGLVCLFAVWSTGNSKAATLVDYQERLTAARSLIEQLHTDHQDVSLASPDQLVNANLARVRQLLPAKETVLISGQSVPVDNSWLHEGLAEFDQASGQARRREILARTSERLLALSERLKETGSEQAVDKDANKGRLAEILRRPEYQHTAQQQSALERLLERFLRWLDGLLPKRSTAPPAGSSSVISAVAQILVVGICVAAIALLIWRYGPRLVQGRRKKKAKREARIVLGERLEPDQTGADLLAQAEQLARAGDLRAAIRKAYIALLCELGDRKLVSLAQHKTNRDYLNSVRDKASLYASMRKLTHSFELHWYGFVPVGQNDWTEFREAYQETLKTG